MSKVVSLDERRRKASIVYIDGFAYQPLSARPDQEQGQLCLVVERIDGVDHVVDEAGKLHQAPQPHHRATWFLDGHPPPPPKVEPAPVDDGGRAAWLHMLAAQRWGT